jgi:RNA polymerase sigma-70 factor, ECF subfamily
MSTSLALSTASPQIATSSGSPPELVLHRAALLRRATRLMRDSVDAEDLVHDTFERALRSFARYVPGTNLRAWLYTILVRLALDRFRREKGRRTDDVDLEAVPMPEEGPPPSWCAITPAQMRAALATISPGLRAVFEMHDLEHLTYQQVATRLHVPINTVASRLRRARARLRVLLGANVQ